MGWLPRGFEHPVRVAVPGGYHLRPINADDVDLDYPAVMGSRPRLWAMFGAPWGWPNATMTYEQDRDDLARHAAEITHDRRPQGPHCRARSPARRRHPG